MCKEVTDLEQCSLINWRARHVGVCLHLHPVCVWEL